MSDIVERLREYCGSPYCIQLRADAAAEVERLQAQNAEVAAFLDALADGLDDEHLPNDAKDCRAMAAKLREGR